jgi:hypothetical protein
MAPNKSEYIGVCGSGNSGLAEAKRIAGESGTWPLVEISWPAIPPIEQLNQIGLYLLGTTSDGPADDLVGFLRERPPETPLVVIGKNPARMAQPTLWLPTAPPSDLLVAIFMQMLGANGSTGADAGGAKAPCARPPALARSTRARADAGLDHRRERRR